MGTIIVEPRERLCRFGFEYIEVALSARGARILVVDDGEVEDDLVRDATEVMTSLCARLYGKRSARRRAERATYQTRKLCDDAALSAYAALYGRVQRDLFAEVSSGRSAASRSAASMKRDCVREYRIPARMFNAVRVSLDGKVSGARESQPLHAETLKGLVRRAGRELASAGEMGDRHRVHQKMRRLDNLRSRLARVEAGVAAGLVRLCLGGRKLWRGQYNLEANGYTSHEEWLAGWRDARSGEFFVPGSRDETGGCQLCVAGVAGDGSRTLQLRMPGCLAGQHGKYVILEDVRFAYGHEQVLAALQANLEFAECRRRDGERAARATSLGQAISYRFKRDEKGWRVFVTTDLAPLPAATDRRRGAIGVDRRETAPVADTAVPCSVKSPRSTHLARSTLPTQVDSDT